MVICSHLYRAFEEPFLKSPKSKVMATYKEDDEAELKKRHNLPPPGWKRNPLLLAAKGVDETLSSYFFLAVTNSSPLGQHRPLLLMVEKSAHFSVWFGGLILLMWFFSMDSSLRTFFFNVFIGAPTLLSSLRYLYGSILSTLWGGPLQGKAHTCISKYIYTYSGEQYKSKRRPALVRDRKCSPGTKSGGRHKPIWCFCAIDVCCALHSEVEVPSQT